MIFYCLSCNLPAVRLRCRHHLHVADFDKFVHYDVCPFCSQPAHPKDILMVVHYLQATGYFENWTGTFHIFGFRPVNLTCRHSIRIVQYVSYLIQNKCPECSCPAHPIDKYNVIRLLQEADFFKEEGEEETGMYSCLDDCLDDNLNNNSSSSTTTTSEMSPSCNSPNGQIDLSEIGWDSSSRVPTDLNWDSDAETLPRSSPVPTESSRITDLNWDSDAETLPCSSPVPFIDLTMDD